MWKQQQQRSRFGASGSSTVGWQMLNQWQQGPGYAPEWHPSLSHTGQLDMQPAAWLLQVQPAASWMSAVGCTAAVQQQQQQQQ
jgi:hypothetical protein